MSIPTEAAWLRAIRSAAVARQQAEMDLIAAIEGARRSGYSWGKIAIAAGMNSRSAMYQWYRRARVRADRDQ